MHDEYIKQYVSTATYYKGKMTKHAVFERFIFQELKQPFSELSSKHLNGKGRVLQYYHPLST